MMVQVDGIGSLKQYRRVLDYLSGVHGISAVTADTVTPSSMRFHVQTDGGMDAVLQTIALGDVLEKVDEPVIDSTPVVTLPKSPEAAVQSPDGAGSQEGGATEPGAGNGEAEPVQPSVRVLHYRLVP
jgi:hypothetical protein